MKFMGLVRIGHHLAYGSKHGFGVGWLPFRVQRVIVFVWNHITCFLLGHDVYGPWIIEGIRRDKFCSACCKEWPEEK